MNILKIKQANANTAVKVLFLLSAVVVLCTTQLYAKKDPVFPASAIPAELKKGAHAVVRQERQELHIRSVGSASLKVFRAITILDKQGEKYAFANIYQDGKLVKSSLTPGRAFDALGNEIASYKSKDVHERSGSGGGQFIVSQRYLYTDMRQARYPYTVTYSYTMDLNGFFSLPSWNPNASDLAVEKATFKLLAPRDFSFRYQSQNGAGEPKIQQTDKGSSYLWSVTKLKAIEREPWGPDYEELASGVWLAPDQANIQEYAGDVANWNNISQYKDLFYNTLLTPTSSMRAEVVSITKDAATTKEKVKMLYKYMQGRTRYVGIQLGIGGWEPFSPEYVHEKGYGDCKALSNYMRSLLHAAQIKSYPVAIYAGDDPTPVKTDFPSVNQFNHIILCVPLEQDTCWLECTSQSQPFGYLGSFTENRYGLLIAPEGGGLVRTPSRPAVLNRQIRKAEFTLQDGKHAPAHIEVCYTGNQQENWRGASQALSGSDLEEWVDERTGLSSFYRESLDIKTRDDEDEPQLTCTLTGTVANMSKPSGSRIFLKLNPFAGNIPVPDLLESRTQDVIIGSGFYDIDTITFIAPAAYGVESAPEDIRFDSPWGSYEARFIPSPDGKLTYIRSLKIEAARRGPETYKAWRDFLLRIKKADRMQVVLVKS